MGHGLFLKRPHLGAKRVHFNELQSQGKTKFTQHGLWITEKLNKLRRVFIFFARLRSAQKKLFWKYRCKDSTSSLTIQVLVFIVDAIYKRHAPMFHNYNFIALCFQDHLWFDLEKYACKHIYMCPEQIILVQCIKILFLDQNGNNANFH